MDFTTGTFEIGGVAINPKTTLSTLKESPNFQVTEETYPYTTISVAETRLGKQDFKADVYCVYNQIDKIRLTPIHLSEEEPIVMDIAYQELRRRACDAFLLTELGVNLHINPSDITQSGLFYEFSWGGIARWINLDEHPKPNAGGYIEITYPDDWRRSVLMEFGK